MKNDGEIQYKIDQLSEEIEFCSRELEKGEEFHEPSGKYYEDIIAYKRGVLQRITRF